MEERTKRIVLRNTAYCVFGPLRPWVSIRFRPTIVVNELLFSPTYGQIGNVFVAILVVDRISDLPSVPM
jgi:hypothetical protein